MINQQKNQQENWNRRVQKQPQYTMWVGCKMDIEKIKLAIKDDIDYFTEENDQERLKEEQKQIQVQEFELRKIKKNYEQQEKDIIELAEKKTQALTNEDKIQMVKAQYKGHLRAKK
ncbi:hypothetical protein PPERSA_06372 [Pseudocohnilembus persalinus]|uniref:Uncharacterized protein n=1 Tax=Pseudocohnilembus persalinus TaxID=266149 RepID=A0A0V0QIP4_PSEPJ|nr:hypothetical protein PPERSA_06372 [Pseudocohnilembus persalinus]|eukprot:KRX02177.1 hypothetical protein PPERSA_06372 [Pseudocohnilembus persalinus]